MKEKILIILFMIILIVPSVVYYIWFPDVVVIANRVLAPAPEYNGDVDLFIEDFESYYSDHIPFKKYLVSIKNEVDIKLFNEVDTFKVSIGKDGWLFHRGDYDTEIQKYVGSPKYNEKTIEIAYNRINKVLNNLEEKGIKVQFMLAANKETIYPEYFSTKYKQAEIDSTEEYVKYMANKGIDIFYTKDLMFEKKQEELPLYYKTDLHWNSVGAYYSSNALLKLLGKDELKVTFETEPFKGNLARLLGIIDYPSEDFYYNAIFEKEYDITQTTIISDNFYVENKTVKNDSTIFLVADSFSTLMHQYINKYYNKTYRLYLYELEPMFIPDSSIEAKKGDTVVFEVIERNLTRLPYAMERFEKIIKFK